MCCDGDSPLQTETTSCDDVKRDALLREEDCGVCPQFLCVCFYMYLGAFVAMVV